MAPSRAPTRFLTTCRRAPFYTRPHRTTTPQCLVASASAPRPAAFPALCNPPRTQTRRFNAGKRIQAAAAVQAPEPPDYLDDKERGIFLRLREALDPVALEVQDISGGCGSMYAVAITAEAFRGLPVIKQHRLVNDILKSDIKEWHGIQLRTKVP